MIKLTRSVKHAKYVYCIWKSIVKNQIVSLDNPPGIFSKLRLRFTHMWMIPQRIDAGIQFFQKRYGGCRVVFGNVTPDRDKVPFRLRGPDD